eukprot:CAMPEP_0170533366 /NCGR_PEP_ID=MMETSP0209-20121228/81543_1 /TAXON_ID=665100 ORGANISM="Litonotus pictus, Strain P1" /NCGR_SAMPLE_ID=MMETSP0209 /ASSEMBLY_ACC=CAM_ASM_000301 /LENGTH=158 /DNA_ID=CAMNT_0010830955 /DNA_START=518 /DNA_END=991 /DNA_ORIENTATION=+
MILMVRKTDGKNQSGTNNGSFFLFSGGSSKSQTHKFEFFNLFDEKYYEKSLQYDYNVNRKKNNNSNNQGGEGSSSLGKFVDYFYGGKNEKNELKNKTKSATISNMGKSNLSNSAKNLNTNDNLKGKTETVTSGKETNKHQTQFFLVTIYYSLYLICLN